MEPKKPFHEVVAEKLIKQLETNTAPWQRPWEPGQGGMLPLNPTTGNRYKGINAIQLMSENREDNRWLTYKQAEAIGAQVRKGEKGTPVQYWKFTEEQNQVDDQGKPIKDENGLPVKVTINLERPRVFMATVFNAEQIDGLPPREVKENLWNAHERAEQILRASGAKIIHSDSDRAFYRSSTDSIHLPEKTQFPTADNYYATALHELGHWTGHESRLDRDLANPFGSEAYAKEELRAEIASMILGDELGIGHDPEQHVAYVGSWIRALKDDPMEIFRAAADAEKIQSFVLAFEQKQELNNQLSEYHQSALNYLGHHFGLNELTSEQYAFLNNASQAGDAPIVGAIELADTFKLKLTTDGFNYAIAQNLVHNELNIRNDETISFIHGGFDADKGFNKYILNIDASAFKHVIGVDFNNSTAEILETISKIENISAAPNQEQFTKDLNSLSPRTQQNARIQSVIENYAGIDPGLDRAQGELSMATPPVTKPTIEQNEEPRLWQLADNPDEYGAKAGWWVVVSADEQEELSRPIETEEAAEIERQRITAQQSFVKGFRERNFDDWLDAHANTAFGFEVPHEWNGNVEFRANIVEEDNGERFVLPASERGVEPQFYSLYAQLNDGTHEFLADYDNLGEALTVKENLETAAANLEANELERAAKLARIHEERVRRDPASTDDEISAAKEYRKDAEMNAMLNDSELQKEIAETEKKYKDLAAEINSQPNKSAATEIAYISVPYAEKEAAKALGAKWDRKEQSWYIPPGLNPEPFAMWTQTAPQIAPAAISEPTQGQPTGVPAKNASERVYLAVPYGEREAAKLAGAQWDKTAKSWYVRDNPDSELIKRWLPENVTAQQGPAKTPQEEFADALRSVGCIVPPSSDHPIMDGKKHRIETNGDKNGEKSGFYVGHLDGHPAGYIKNNKTSVDIRWKSKGYSLSDEDKAKLNAEAANKLATRAADQEKTQEQTATRINAQMSKLVQINEPTPYLDAKGVQAHKGALTDAEGKTTYIPAHDINGKVWTMQYIAEDGTKRFAKDSKKEGCFHVVGGIDALERAPAIVVGEGYATATTASESLGFATVAAFDSGNLSAVVKDLHEKYPDKPIIVIGDDDRHLAMTQGTNPGRLKAEAAAKEVGGRAIFPVFTPNEQIYPAELPVITPEKYRKKELSNEQLDALSQIKKFTDFNDMATKSELGKEGVDRQLKSALSKVLSEANSLSETKTTALNLDHGKKNPGARLEQETEQTKKKTAKI